MQLEAEEGGSQRNNVRAFIRHLYAKRMNLEKHGNGSDCGVYAWLLCGTGNVAVNQ